MNIQDLQDKRICADCIGESFLSAIIESKGRRRKCAYCATTGRTISVEELSDRTQAVLEKFYQRTSENPDNYQSALMADKESDYTWYRDGELIIDVIEDVAGILRQAAEDVQAILQSRFYDRSSEEIGEETEFCKESHYEPIDIRSKAWEEKWNAFANSLKTNTRYFNQLGKEYLDTVFKDIIHLKTLHKSPVMKAGPGHKLKTAYRARVFLSDENLRHGLSNLVEQLGPPPPQFAKAGRMNAAGISVFYGATDQKTALAEVRPPVGSKVVLAKFSIIRELRLLNLIELQNTRVSGSVFDESYADLLSRVHFLNQLCDKMTIPVMPGEEDMEYLVTQAIADYLSFNAVADLDGIVFPSIQTKNGYNLVLFQKASRIAARSLPSGTEISVDLYDYYEDRRYPSYSVNEETPRIESEKYNVQLTQDVRENTLKLNAKNIDVHIIEAVEYASDSHRVQIRRYETPDYAEIENRLKDD